MRLIAEGLTLLGLVALAPALMPATAQAQTAPMNCDLGYAKLTAMLRAKGHAGGPAAADVERIDDADQARVYFITRPGHPAHPAVIVQDVGLSQDGVNVHTEGCVYGDADAFRAWFATVRARVDEIRAQLQPKKGHPAGR
jgi:hypothetical protein